MSNLTLLIDADVLVYKAAATVERDVDWGDGLWSLYAEESEGIRSLEAQIATLQDLYPGAEAVYTLTDGINFRLSILSTYKANRKGKRRPVLLPALREHLLENYRTYLRPGLEGDDCLGILSTSKTIIPGDKLILSVDKDMRCIPGRFHDFGRNIVYDITPAEADRFHMYQTLIGDTTDGYAGCPGVGPERAETALSTMTAPSAYEHTVLRGARKGEKEIRYEPKQCDTLWEVVVKHYEAAGLTEADALVQARVARILRCSDFDFNKKTPILWEPQR